MKIEISGDCKEIANFVFAVQNRQNNIDTQFDKADKITNPLETMQKAVQEAIGGNSARD